MLDVRYLILDVGYGIRDKVYEILYTINEKRETSNESRVRKKTVCKINIYTLNLTLLKIK
jgi:hypothetical protein